MARVLGGAFSLVPGIAGAQNADAVRWHEDWPRVSAAEIVATELLLAGALVLERAAPEPLGSASGPVLFDDAARRALRLDDEADREAARNVSDTMLYSLLAWPIALDGVVVAGVAHASTDVFAQTSLVALESYAISWALVNATKVAVGRRRPSDDCAPGDTRATCDDANRRHSYPSGHAALAFTAAGLVCVSHRHLPLYGSGALDATACIGAVGLASTVSVLRVAADRHWTSDVLGGAFIGALSGFVVPSLLHYRSRRPGETTSASAAALERPPVVLGHTGTF